MNSNAIRQSQIMRPCSRGLQLRYKSTKPVLDKKRALPPLSPRTRDFLARLIRVDQAGELGADLIYSGQHAVFKRTKPDLAPLIAHMWEQEVHHHKTFNELQATHRVRPSVFSPLWNVAAYGLGVGTALLGKEAAMACTLAVETVIGGHYNNQLRELLEMIELEAKQAEDGQTSDELRKLAKLISQFRDDELEHLDTAVENDAEKARPYMLLTETIKGGCRAAVWTAERF
ncbi:ubiquinone biosynthesis protein COQ7-domain-containing protein [Kockiozyma suomiensis]|uniref:ubiquinone biosynthesis protein COQ7-domain-containing protein n=1 Tax=Kockiozyma suomiensis TaxID=1337062 RepID=UPI00334364BD